MNPDDLNQICDPPHNNRPTPDIAPSFNVCCVLVIDVFERSYMYLSAANNCVKKYHKEIDSSFL